MSAPNLLFDAPGPKARVRHRILTVLGMVLAAGVAWLALAKMKDAGQLDGSLWKPFLTDGELWREYLLAGLINTLKAAALSVVLAAIFGIVFGMGRLSSNLVIRFVSGAVVEFFRSVPVLLMMIFLFFGYFGPHEFPSASTSSLAAVVLALTLYNGSVIAELVRSGVFSLPSGQREAGLSIGLSESNTLRTVLLPQALTAMLPALISQFVVILKDTALGVQITYPDLLNTASQIGSRYSNTVPAYVVIGCIFVLLNYLLTMVASRVEKKIRSKGMTAGPVLTTAPNLVQGDANPGEPTTHGMERVGGRISDMTQRTRFEDE